MKELGAYAFPLRHYIGYLIPSFPTKNQPDEQAQHPKRQMQPKPR